MHNDNEQNPFLKSTSLNCVDVEELLDCYIDGEMIAPLRERLEVHLKSCDGCRDLMNDGKSLTELAGTLDDQPIPVEISLRLREALRERVGYNVTYLKPRLTLIK